MYVSRERSARACSHESLEAILARVVDVAFDRALTVAREPQARVEPMRVLEARIRPEDQPADALRATPLERALHQRITEALPAPLGIDVETIQLGGVAVEALDAHRSDHALVRSGDPESAAVTFVVRGKVEEVRHLGDRLPDPPVLGEHPPDQVDDRGCVIARGP